MFNLGWIDAHCHLSEERISVNLEKEISEASQLGITGFISSALCKEEYEQIKLPKFQKLRKFTRWCAGIHPYYEKSSEEDFDHLVELCDKKKIIAIGEIGLDGRKNNSEWQKKILLKQLDLAKNYDLPVIFHTVKKYYVLYKILKQNFPKVRGFLHSFNASLEITELFSKYNLAFSLNAKIPNTKVLEFIMKRGFFFFETDAPYQKPENSKDDFNHLKNLIRVVDKVSEKTNIEKDILKEKQFDNFQMLFG